MSFLEQTLFFCCFITIWTPTQEVIYSGNKGIMKYANNFDPDLLIHKVSFTQKGYIQFLKYVSDVPPLTDYTFCIWVRSNNLTFSHPIVSYSKHEEERLIRFWISPGGTHLNLEILNIPVFMLPSNFKENHWYHICQSWSAYQAAWNLYINGKLKSSGFEPKLRGVHIKGGGDIVVGQEYTDFDEGLDDGIEGDVFGFNFVLAPTSLTSKFDVSLRRHYLSTDDGILRPPLHQYIPSSYPANEVPSVLSYFSVEPNRKSKGIFDLFNILLDSPPTSIRVKIQNDINRGQFDSRVVNDVDEYFEKPLGLKLVELSYKCFLGKGSPVGGRDVLISWTRTPVRVFGGAILKPIPPFCL